MSEKSGKVRYAEVPSEEWVRYMAILYRALLTAERNGEAQNMAGIWLAGVILDAIHNVPDMLRHYDEAYWYSPSRTHEWLYGFSQLEVGPGYPEWLVEGYRKILSFDRETNLRTLSMKEESQLVRPPDAICSLLLDRLYYWCIEFRRAVRIERFMNENPLSDYERRRRDWMGIFAKGLLPAPLLLTRWSESQWAEYQEMVQVVPTELPAEKEQAWKAFFAKIREI